MKTLVAGLSKVQDLGLLSPATNGGISYSIVSHFFSPAYTLSAYYESYVCLSIRVSKTLAAWPIPQERLRWFSRFTRVIETSPRRKLFDLIPWPSCWRRPRGHQCLGTGTCSSKTCFTSDPRSTNPAPGSTPNGRQLKR